MRMSQMASLGWMGKRLISSCLRLAIRRNIGDKPLVECLFLDLTGHGANVPDQAVDLHIHTRGLLSSLLGRVQSGSSRTCQTGHGFALTLLAPVLLLRRKAAHRSSAFMKGLLFLSKRKLTVPRA